jgi:hypothetical protein
MKKLVFTKEDKGVFACLYESMMVCARRITGVRELRMFNRIMDTLEAVSDGTSGNIDAIGKIAKIKHGSTLVSVHVVYRELIVKGNEVELEFQDEDFHFLKERAEATPWDPGVRREALGLVEMLEKA